MSNIYVIQFQNTDKVYIGQTVKPIEVRLHQHLIKLRAGTHHSKKLQKVFSSLGDASIYLLESCADDKANEREIYWVAEFNSYYNGFKGTLGGDASGVSFEHGAAKFALEDYLCVITLAALTNLTYKEIHEETGVTINIIQDIITKRNHTSLREYLPELYDSMNKVNRMGRTNIKEGGWGTWRNTNTEETVVVENMNKFCEERGLSSSKMTLVNQGKRNQHLGWVKVC